MSSPKRKSSNSVRTARPSTVRDVNRAIVLSLIRAHQPISRADLSKRTGIFRSNISCIVDALIADGVAREQRATPNGRGRVPLMLSLRDDSYRVAAASIRENMTSVASAGLTATPLKVVQFRTPANPAKAVEEIASAIRYLQSEGARPEVGNLAVSIPGLVDAGTGEVLWISALPQYSGYRLRAELEKATGLQVDVENDCNLAALADLQLRQAEMASLRNSVFLEIGDVGVGGGIVVNGELYRGHDARFAGEFGHVIVEIGGAQCRCGRRGCWEQYISDTATWRRYRPGVGLREDSIEQLLGAARHGDANALNALQETARYLSAGISNIMLAFNPELIVLAGRIMEGWALLRKYMEIDFAPARVDIPVRPARLAPEPLFLRGALLLALKDVFAMPALGA
ncbi:MAG: ROK family transcriptional regulator [Bryobacterales bacterium]|nr:ROK family transcriptional regulator [Bryobacterales bacterium]